VRIAAQGFASFTIGGPTNVLIQLGIPGRFELPPGVSCGQPCCTASLGAKVLTKGIFYLAARVLHQLETEPQLVIAAVTSLNTATDSSLPV
jgi:hypothetical protein